ncbi:hypothetical protein BJF78_32740 [Pseudonocardia sp. CNS-139]|nr:hypothetical protein BJF78_32740 [Pseudonocardia sp. CNS-139]
MTRRQLRIEPVSLADAQAFVARHHRHHPAPVGHKFSQAVTDQRGQRRGVAITGRPSARALNDGRTLEVTRVCTDGTANACSALLAAAWRAARELGFHRLITYTQAEEGGASLRAAGWRMAAELRPRNGWDSPGRPRHDQHPTRVRRFRWEVTTPDFRHAEQPARDEKPGPRCAFCTGPLGPATRGRPARYCGSACRQAAYRARTTTRPGVGSRRPRPIAEQPTGPTGEAA